MRKALNRQGVAVTRCTVARLVRMRRSARPCPRSRRTPAGTDPPPPRRAGASARDPPRGRTRRPSWSAVRPAGRSPGTPPNATP
ncbi:hypothetical protein [Spongiactinospora gelatinilytica]|uniref:hypothetical protein n=1 Tax=Spongiactinospora gelatinilytica TaxID=2666298 RepID=UPI0034D287EF